MALLADLKNLFGVSGANAEPTLRGNRGTLYAVSSFGVDGTTFGKDFNPQALLDSDRHRELDFRSKYARNAQHDHKVYDGQGRFKRGGRVELSQPLIGSSMPSTYVPLDQRRPNAPYRLARLIIRRFTGLVFGHGHWPEIRVEGDEATTDFLTAIVEAAQMPAAFVRARNKGGGCGTAVLSWRFWDGAPRVRVHEAKYVFVHAWADREELVIEHASELYQVVRDEYDAQKKAVVRRPYWVRRDWTLEADIAFEEVPVDGKAPQWIVDEANTVIHGDGEAHLVWIQNLPNENDEASADGLPDTDGLFESLDNIDTLSMVLNNGTIRNMDPTLVLKLDPELVKGVVAKGSDNALKVGTTGDAKYLELAGSAATAGMALRDKERQQVLEVSSCVVADPNEIAAAATSGAAIRLLYAPMLSQGDVYRTQYGPGGIVKLLGQMLRSAKRFYPALNEETGEWEYPVELDDETQAPRPVAYYLKLPPKVVEEEIYDEHGQPTGETSKTLVERHPGQSEHIALVWGDYFPPTPADQQATTTLLGVATGGRPVLSQKTAIELAAQAMGRDPLEEQRRVEEETAAARQRQADMFPDAGGKVSAIDELPAGAAPLATGNDNGDGNETDDGEETPAAPAPDAAAAATATATATPEAKAVPEAKALVGSTDELVHLVNELRARAGSGPLMLPNGQPDPDGLIPAVLFKAKLAALGEAAGKAIGSAKGAVDAAVINPPPPPAAVVAPPAGPAEPDGSTPAAPSPPPPGGPGGPPAPPGV